ncbi:hypothetical protein [Spirosoma rhododendri]|uniref:Uncharacterized protein n=1 Tax=Spirosoma rhododendri TaxID=2728024 RepID=A0A7L5DH67_9BACT|nr:hypothetical protein [Spirosoma rhododendri]QJD77355.1 hypothetical protein HH216_02155 [Spirosoma rhododendri]
MPSSFHPKRLFRSFRFPLVFVLCLSISLLTLAQTNLTFRLFGGYLLSTDAPVNKGKATLFIFNDADAFSAVFKPATTTNRRPDAPNFKRDMVVGIVTPATSKPPRLSVSRVFVQDSILTVRYIRLADTAKTAQSFVAQPLLLLSIPRQTVLRTRLIENGKVVQTIKQTESASN